MKKDLKYGKLSYAASWWSIKNAVSLSWKLSKIPWVALTNALNKETVVLTSVPNRASVAMNRLIKNKINDFDTFSSYFNTLDILLSHKRQHSPITSVW